MLYFSAAGALSAFTSSVYLYPEQFDRIALMFRFERLGWTITSIVIAAASFIYKENKELSRLLFNSAKFVFGATVVNLFLYSLLVTAQSKANLSLQGFWYQLAGTLAILVFWNLWIGVLYLSEFFLKIDDLFGDIDEL